MQLVGRFTSPLVVAISMFTAVVATLAVNIAANVVSPANDFANAFPKYINFKTGGLITGILGIAIMPWKLLADPSGYIFTWLLGYSGGLGSIAGVLIADYWLVRRTELRLEDLYLPDGAYQRGELEGAWLRRWPAARSPGAALWCLRWRRSTTMRGLSGCSSQAGCTGRCRCSTLARLACGDLKPHQIRFASTTSSSVSCAKG